MPVEIVSISPETIEVRNGRVVPTTFTVEYRIAQPEKVNEAELRIESEGFGVLQRQKVPVEASASVTMTVNTTEDFGPVVRFRVVCPAGTTEWKTLGEPLPDVPARPEPGVRLTAVSPRYIRPSYTDSQGGGERIRLSGSGITADCKIEGERDGSPIQLNNPYFRDGAMQGLLLRRDIDDRPVGKRYLDFGVSIRGPGVGQINLKRVLFSE